MREIGTEAFVGCTALETAQFPATLEKIGQKVFGGCSSLKAVDLSGTKVREIGTEAFYNCPALETVQFPTTLETIGKEAFSSCSNHLGSVTFADVQNWAVYNDENYKNKYADIPESDLQDAAKAATLLTSIYVGTYEYKYWKKN